MLGYKQSNPTPKLCILFVSLGKKKKPPKGTTIGKKIPGYLSVLRLYLVKGLMSFFIPQGFILKDRESMGEN